MNKKLLVLLGVLGVSFSSIFVRFATAPSAILVLYRNGFAAAMLLPVILAKYRGEIRALSAKNILICCLSGFFLALHFFFFFESVKYTSVASSTALVNTEVFFVAFISAVLFKEKIGKLPLIGIAITFAGSVIIGLGDSGQSNAAIYGDIMAVLGGAAMSLYTIIGRRSRQNISTVVYTFFVYMAASATMAAYTAFAGLPLAGYGGVNYAMALCMAVFCTFMGHSIFSYCLKYVNPVFISTAKLGEPLFATILALVLFWEMPGIIQIAGALMVVGGLYFYTKHEQKAEL